MNIIYVYFLYFVVYSFLGWICETIYCFIIDKQYANRGFLRGPFCPIYGVGALIVTLALTSVADDIILLYFYGMIFTSILEYITGFLLEVIFNLKWWDYSNYKFNIHGRVCLLNSILFGILSVIAVKIINPIVVKLIGNIPLNMRTWISSILIIYFFIDTIITAYKVLQLGRKLKEMHVVFEEIKEKSENYKEILQQNINKLDKFIEQKNEKVIYAKEQISKLKTKLESIILRNKSVNKRIIKAFPNIKSLKYQHSLDRLKEELKNRRKK
ncbi:putative ABC transporter permease [Clostridium sp.]|uniref:putative ABC transporter permease n=1 Tax=Clostridium sp. TaxID=1506 RepID=UPI00283BABC9|nr:hypothetical protein [Clostridium sp.]MDR3598733.1 hypothetical protein [Clostridium sp.]